MADLKDFDPSKVQDTGFDPLPEGAYIAAVVSSEMKTTKAGDGTFLKMELDILDGKYKGRKIWWNINYTNPNAQCQNIGRSELKKLCAACGKPAPKDTLEIHNIPFTIHLKVEPAKDGYDAGNRVKKVEPKAAYVAPPVGGTAPWAK